MPPPKRILVEMQQKFSSLGTFDVTHTFLTLPMSRYSRKREYDIRDDAAPWVSSARAALTLPNAGSAATLAVKALQVHKILAFVHASTTAPFQCRMFPVAHFCLLSRSHNSSSIEFTFSASLSGLLSYPSLPETSSIGERDCSTQQKDHADSIALTSLTAHVWTGEHCLSGLELLPAQHVRLLEAARTHEEPY